MCIFKIMCIDINMNTHRRHQKHHAQKALVNFSKISSTILLHNNLSSKLTNEKLCMIPCDNSNPSQSWQNFSKDSCTVILHTKLSSKLLLEKLYMRLSDTSSPSH